MANKFESQQFSHVFDVIRPLEHVDTRIGQQIDDYLVLRNQVQETHGFPRSDQERRFLHTMVKDIVDERNARASDLASEEVQEAEAIANNIFPLPIYGFLCIDSRVTATTMYGLVAAGRITRVPMGDVFEFEQSENEGLVLRENASFDALLEQAFSQDDVITQNLDSHHECAAREREEKNDKGAEPNDHGLYQDVLRKRRISTAMIEHVSENFPGKTVMPIQTSFDPHTGAMDMGLELDEPLRQAEERGGFDQELLGELRGSGEVINTRNIARDPQVRELFMNRIIPDLDWGSHDQYRNSQNLFWRNVADMKEEGLIEVVKEHVRRLYSDRTELEIEQRSVMVAVNAYNRFLLNYGKRYPYSEHKESCVVISEGGKGPFGKNSSFSVSRASNELSGNILLAAGIVRDNREKGRIIDYTQSYGDTIQYRCAPVPAILEVVIRNDEQGDWEKADLIDWSDMPKNWDQMNAAEFFSYLNVKGIVSEDVMNVVSLKEQWHDAEFFRYLRRLKIPVSPLALGMNILREDMIRVYSPQYRLHRFVIGGQIEVLPVVSDRHRKIKAIPPFIHTGYKRKTKE